MTFSLHLKYNFIFCKQKKNIQIQSARAKAYCKNSKEGTVTKIQYVKDK